MCLPKAITRQHCRCVASKARFSDVPTDGSEFLVMPGFVAANEAGEKVTLGRNGSDYSAAILAAYRCKL